MPFRPEESKSESAAEFMSDCAALSSASIAAVSSAGWVACGWACCLSMGAAEESLPGGGFVICTVFRKREGEPRINASAIATARKPKATKNTRLPMSFGRSIFVYWLVDEGGGGGGVAAFLAS